MPAWVLKAWAGGKTSIAWAGGSHYDEQLCGGETGVMEKQSSLLWEEAELKNQGSEGLVDMGGLLATQGHGDIQALGCC